jgi:hypothetical protein
LDKEIVPPGDSARLEVIFSTKSYKGRVAKVPRIYSNADTVTNAFRMVRITAMVEPRPDSTFPVVVMPYKLDVSQFGSQKRDQASFTVKNVSEQNLDLSLVVVPDDVIRVELPNSVGPGQTVTGRVIVRPPALKEEFERSFTFEVSDSAHTRFTIPVQRGVRSQASSM